MRNISFSLTTPQFRARTKHVTRRLGWRFLQAGDQLMACEKCMGLKRGQSPVRLGAIRVTQVTREPLRAMLQNPRYGATEAFLEGFPGTTGDEFVDMFCRHMRCTPDTTVTRIAFEYL